MRVSGQQTDSEKDQTLVCIFYCLMILACNILHTHILLLLWSSVRDDMQREVKLTKKLCVQLEQYIHKASGQGILTALYAKAEGDLEKLAQLADDCNLDRTERAHLRAFLTQAQLSHSHL